MKKLILVLAAIASFHLVSHAADLARVQVSVSTLPDGKVIQMPYFIVDLAKPDAAASRPMDAVGPRVRVTALPGSVAVDFRQRTEGSANADVGGILSMQTPKPGESNEASATFHDQVKVVVHVQHLAE